MIHTGVAPFAALVKTALGQASSLIYREILARWVQYSSMVLTVAPIPDDWCLESLVRETCCHWGGYKLSQRALRHFSDVHCRIEEDFDCCFEANSFTSLNLQNCQSNDLLYNHPHSSGFRAGRRSLRLGARDRSFWASFGFSWIVQILVASFCIIIAVAGTLPWLLWAEVLQSIIAKEFIRMNIFIPLLITTIL